MKCCLRWQSEHVHFAKLFKLSALVDKLAMELNLTERSLELRGCCRWNSIVFVWNAYALLIFLRYGYRNMNENVVTLRMTYR